MIDVFEALTYLAVAYYIRYFAIVGLFVLLKECGYVYPLLDPGINAPRDRTGLKSIIYMVWFCGSHRPGFCTKTEDKFS